MCVKGRSRREILGVRTPPPLFGAPPNFIKRKKTRHTHAREQLTVTETLPPLSEIMYAPLCVSVILEQNHVLYQVYGLYQVL